MSFDISLEINTGIEMTEVVSLRSSISANYSQMLKALFNVEHVYAIGERGEAGALISVLEEALKELTISDRVFFYDSFIPYHKGCSLRNIVSDLTELLELCRKHPKCTVVIR